MVQAVPALKPFKSIVRSLAQCGQQPLEWSAEHVQTAQEFLSSTKNLVCFAVLSHNKSLSLTHAFPFDQANWASPLVYLIRDDSMAEEVITLKTFHKRVKYGSCTEKVLESLLTTMQSLYSPALETSAVKWPQNIRKEFTQHSHRFMAHLTDAVYQCRGQTVLYVPPIQVSNPSIACRSKEIIQHCETAMVFFGLVTLLTS